MKHLFALLFVTLSLSPLAMADGFRCIGNGYRVKMYNEVKPHRGTRNPAILVVSEEHMGTLATLINNDINKTIHESTVSYEGVAHAARDGRFVYVKLEIGKHVVKKDDEGTRWHDAALTLTMNGETRNEELSCARYYKHPREDRR
jgi:hypothetical protein